MPRLQAARAPRYRGAHPEAQTPALYASWRLELHPVESFEQGLGVLLIASLARVVGAQSHAAHAGQLLRRDLGILITLELVPEALVGLAAIHLALGDRSRGREHGKGNKGSCETLHI